MVSVFIEAVPANLLIAKAVCDDNKNNNADYSDFGMQIRIRADKKLVLKRGRGLTETEWQSVTLNHIGAISKFEQNEIVFVDSEESRVLDEYWDKRLKNLKK